MSEGMAGHPWEAGGEGDTAVPLCPMLGFGGLRERGAPLPTSAEHLPPHPLAKKPASPRPHPRGGGEGGAAMLGWPRFVSGGPGARGRVRGAWDEFSLLARLPGSHPWKCHWKL